MFKHFLRKLFKKLFVNVCVGKCYKVGCLEVLSKIMAAFLAMKSDKHSSKILKQKRDRSGLPDKVLVAESGFPKK